MQPPIARIQFAIPSRTSGSFKEQATAQALYPSITTSKTRGTLGLLPKNESHQHISPRKIGTAIDISYISEMNRIESHSKSTLPLSLPSVDVPSPMLTRSPRPKTTPVTPRAVLPVAHARELLGPLDSSFLQGLLTKFGPDVPETRIPEQYHIAGRPPLPSLEPDCMPFASEIFPTSKPSSRAEVIHVANALADMLHTAAVNAASLSPLEALLSEWEAWEKCLHEVSRQVQVHCTERGLLLRGGLQRLTALLAQAVSTAKAAATKQTEATTRSETVRRECEAERTKV